MKDESSNGLTQYDGDYGKDDDEMNPKGHGA